MRSAHGLTIGKRNLLVFVFLFLLCPLLLCGCFAEQELPDFTPFFSDTETKTSPDSEEVESESSFETVASFAKELRIVVSERASEALLYRASALGDALSERTGLSYTVRNDEYLLAADPHVYEIVLGDTNHTDSALWLAGLKRDDYICAASEAVAVIGGRTELTTLKALDAFCEKLLPLVTREELMPTGVAILKRESYDRGAVSLNGVDLFDWQILCEGEIPRLQAELLRDEIEERSGYVLEICPPSGADASKKGVRISLNEGNTGMAHLIPTSEGITLAAETGVGLRCAVEEFCRMLFGDTDGDGNCQSSLQRTKTFSAERSRFHCSLLLGTDGLTWESPSEIVSVSDWIWKEAQDALAMVDMREETARPIRQNLFESYEWQEHPSCQLGVRTDAFFLDADQLNGDLLGGVRLGGEKGGILWLIVRAGCVLPEWVFEKDIPLVVTVFGEASGMLGEDSAERLDVLCQERITVDGSSAFVGVYSSVGQIRAEAEALDKKAGILDLWMERLF